MFSHIFVGSNDLAASKCFYDAIFATMGVKEGIITPKEQVIYRSASGMLAVCKPINGEPATFGNGTTIGLLVESPAIADAWHAAGATHGGTACEDPPGIRDTATGQLYLAYLRDPDGNKLCAFYPVPKA